MNPGIEAVRNNPASIPAALLLTGLLFVGGCATAPRDPGDQLRAARQSYEAIEKDEEVARSAAESLGRSGRALEEAERLLNSGAGMDRVDHHAYLADRYAEIASEEAEQARLQREIEQARERRQQVRLELEQREALAAQEEAQSAKQVAAELRARLSSLQTKMTERGVVLTLGDVLFDFDEATLKPGGERVAGRIAEFLREFPDHRILVEGHTDSLGPESYNETLSQSRAEALRSAIVQRGIGDSRIAVEGLGEQYPVASNDTEAGRQRNRRVEVVVSDAQGNIKSR